MKTLSPFWRWLRIAVGAQAVLYAVYVVDALASHGGMDWFALMYVHGYVRTGGWVLERVVDMDTGFGFMVYLLGAPLVALLAYAVIFALGMTLWERARARTPRTETVQGG